LPDTDGFGRTRFAISPSQPDTIYAISARADSDALLGIFRSDDAGRTWRNVTSNFGSEGQMSYGLAIAVHPQNSDHVLCGGVDLHLTLNGGATWRKVTRWDAARTSFMPADHHALMPVRRRAASTRNDGGVDVSEDGNLHWIIAVTAAPCSTTSRSPKVIPTSAVAVQDNGTLLTQNSQPGGFAEISGDGGGS
jgi:hypothetical protein